MLYTPNFVLNSPIFGTKLPKCRKYGNTIIYRGTHKVAAELAAKSKYFSGSNHRTFEALKHKSAATLSTIAATFCSIIIEVCPHRTPPNWRYNFCFVHQCSVLHSFGQTKNNSRIVINCRLNWHELFLLSMSRSLHIIRFLHTASRSIFIHNTTATESPQISHRSPIVVPKPVGNFTPDLAK